MYVGLTRYLAAIVSLYVISGTVTEILMMKRSSFNIKRPNISSATSVIKSCTLVLGLLSIACRWENNQAKKGIKKIHLFTYKSEHHLVFCRCTKKLLMEFPTQFLAEQISSWKYTAWRVFLRKTWKREEECLNKRIKVFGHTVSNTLPLFWSVVEADCALIYFQRLKRRSRIRMTLMSTMTMTSPAPPSNSPLQPSPRQATSLPWPSLACPLVPGLQ